MSDQQNKNGSAKDDFWDIGKLVPPKPKSTAKPPLASSRTAASEISVRFQSSSNTSEGEKKLTAATPTATQTADIPPVFAEYSNFSSLIPSVKIVNWKSTYNYYEFFCRQALSLYQRKGVECPEVRFFSYVAQYSQLNRNQLNWYLWWRECVRNGKYLRTDISYIHLLVFEIINLGNAIDTKKSLDILIGLWSNYKNVYPQFTASLGEWICDYSLIHNLPISFPDPRISRDMIDSVSFGEAFFHFDLQDTPLLAKFFLSFCNSYNYRKSKFYTQENRELYDKYLPEAFTYLVEKTDLKAALAARPRKHVSRVAFTGALCSYKTRKHIEVDYITLCASPEFKAYIGDIVKYAENKLRAYLGIRSRLGVNGISQELKDTIDQYFDSTLFAKSGGVKLPDYEKLYDSSDTEFSLTSALDIERSSWEVTEKLVEAFEEDTPQETPAIPTELATPIAPQDELGEGTEEIDAFWEAISRYDEFFRLILNENFDGQRAYVNKHHVLPEAVVDEINEKAADIFGDIVIEDADNGYRIIDDYRSIFEKED